MIEFDPDSPKCPACFVPFHPNGNPDPIKYCRWCGHIYFHDGNEVRSLTLAEKLDVRRRNRECGGEARRFHDSVVERLIG